VNEAARCLAEAIVEGHVPLDLALIFGTGFPPFRGGLCRWADAQGLDNIVQQLESLALRAAPRATPAKAAARGGFYSSPPS
jgi:3-hydroxyacyl-CoA dehydrogenase/enoyl-CoA hydratase/3-hydroxybutyryl-CoA epimerase